jgi:heat shock protein HslJ
MSVTIDIPTPSPVAAALAFALVIAAAAPAQTIQGTQPSPDSGSRPVEGTYWRAIELAGKPIPTQQAAREPHLVFQAEGRIAGADGCNTVTGSYQLKAEVIAFKQLAGTQTACLNNSETPRAYRDALRSAARLVVTGSRLVLFDASGRLLAVFAGTDPAGSGPLAGTSWQLVRFQGSDNTTLTPDDGSKYTLAFGADGQVTARIDCNRGRGAWKSIGTSQLALGPLALTRAQCPAGSLHDQIVKQWPFIRTYVVLNGHLFLSLMADGGIYEFEPAR